MDENSFPDVIVYRIKTVSYYIKNSTNTNVLQKTHRIKITEVLIFVQKFFEIYAQFL